MKKIVKKIFLFSISLYAVGAVAQQQVNPFEEANNIASTWVDPAKSLFNTLIIIGLIIGGIVTFFKMKSSDGSEGKKTALNFVFAIVFVIFIRALLEIF